MPFSKSGVPNRTWYPRCHLTKSMMKRLPPKRTGFTFFYLMLCWLVTSTSHCWRILSCWSFRSLRYFSHDFLPRQSPPLRVFAICFFARKSQTLHVGLLNRVLLFLTQHSNLSGPLWVLILSPLVLTLPPGFVTSTPLISMPPEFSSSDKSDRIKERALGTLQETSLKVDIHCHEWNMAPLSSEEMQLEPGSIHTHPWDCLWLPLCCPTCFCLLVPPSWNLPLCLHPPL